jgi:hypothetical protein
MLPTRMQRMDSTRSEVEQGRVGPTDQPDDPLATARRRAERSPLTPPPVVRKPAGSTAPPTSDQEGCYYLG